MNKSSHDLLLHLSASGIAYPNKERELLKILSHAITWAGRYPTPKKEIHMDDYKNLVRENLYDRVPLGTFTALKPNDALDWESFNGMWSKAMNEYFDSKV